jgi:hypothetical protein
VVELLDAADVEANYYDRDAAYFDGIVRIGQFDGDIDAIARRDDGFRATVERDD